MTGTWGASRVLDDANSKLRWYRTGDARLWREGSYRTKRNRRWPCESVRPCRSAHSSHTKAMENGTTGVRRCEFIPRIIVDAVVL